MWIPQAACGLHQIAVQSAVRLSWALGMAGPQLAAQQHSVEPVHACIYNLQHYSCMCCICTGFWHIDLDVACDMTYEALVMRAMICPPATSCPCSHGQEQPDHPGFPDADLTALHIKLNNAHLGTA